MVRFDGDRRPPREADRFDNIRVKRALRQKLGPVDGVGVFLKHVNEQSADDLALGFRVGLAVKLTQEQLALVGVDQGDVVIVAEHGEDFGRLILTQKTVINKDTGQLITDGFVDQHCCDRRINAA